MDMDMGQNPENLGNFDIDHAPKTLEYSMTQHSPVASSMDNSNGGAIGFPSQVPWGIGNT